MKALHKILNIMLSIMLIVTMFSPTSCRKEVVDKRKACVEETVQVDQAKLLLEYFEKHGDPVNCDESCLMSTEEVHQSLGKNIYILDLRLNKDYNKSHIEGAVHMPIKRIYYHFHEVIKPFKYDRIILCCYSGQSASYAASILRMLGYDNVYVMKWGMAAWNPDLANKWASKVDQELNVPMEQKPNTLDKKHEFPKLNSEFIFRNEIINSRAKTLLNIGFTSARVNAVKLIKPLDSQCVIAYCSKSDYDKSHVKGAIHFPIKESFKRETLLSLLPPDKEILVYSRHGFESAYAVAYLRMLGYNAKTVLFGMSSFYPPFEDSFGLPEVNKFELIKQDDNQLDTTPIDEVGGC